MPIGSTDLPVVDVFALPQILDQHTESNHDGRREMHRMLLFSDAIKNPVRAQ
jgi:hypothetical protein